MITNNDPTMAKAMLYVQEACAVVVDRLMRKGTETMGHEQSWVVFRVGLSPIYGDTNIKIDVTGPFNNEDMANKRASRLTGHTFILGPVSKNG